GWVPARCADDAPVERAGAGAAESRVACHGCPPLVPRRPAAVWIVLAVPYRQVNEAGARAGAPERTAPYSPSRWSSCGLLAGGLADRSPSPDALRVRGQDRRADDGPRLLGTLLVMPARVVGRLHRASRQRPGAAIAGVHAVAHRAHRLERDAHGLGQCLPA